MRIGHWAVAVGATAGAVRGGSLQHSGEWQARLRSENSVRLPTAQNPVNNAAAIQQRPAFSKGKLPGVAQCQAMAHVDDGVAPFGGNVARVLRLRASGATTEFERHIVNG